MDPVFRREEGEANESPSRLDPSSQSPSGEVAAKPLGELIAPVVLRCAVAVLRRKCPKARG